MINRKVMHWKDTLIKSEELNWERPLVKHIADGKMDIQVNIPLTDLFEAQAKWAFAGGMITMLKFYVQKQEGTIGNADLIKLFEDCGLPEAANQFKVVEG